MRENPSSERSLAYRTGSVCDRWGNRRAVGRARRHGTWHLVIGDIDMPVVADDDNIDDIDDIDARRQALLITFERTGLFTATELRTLNALVVDRLEITEIARREGCSPQAVTARLVGNSRGQGGALRKARRLLGATSPQRT